MPMRTVAQLITDSNGTVADLVICLVRVDMFGLAARTTNCASLLAPAQVILLSDTQPRLSGASRPKTTAVARICQTATIQRVFLTKSRATTQR
jgi:hypothetical protein